MKRQGWHFYVGKSEQLVRFAVGEGIPSGRLEGDAIITLAGDVFGACQENGRRHNVNEASLAQK
jgi:hypothetical protein